MQMFYMAKVNWFLEWQTYDEQILSSLVGQMKNLPKK